MFRKKLRDAYVNKSNYEKCAFIVGLTCSTLVILCAVLQLAGVWDGAMVLCQLLMGISLLSQAVLQWKKNRGVAIFSLCAAVFILVGACFILFVRLP